MIRLYFTCLLVLMASGAVSAQSTSSLYKQVAKFQVGG